MEPTALLHSREKDERRIAFTGIWGEEGRRFKLYTITASGKAPADVRTLHIAKKFCRKLIRKYAAALSSCGLGYIILHTGPDVNSIGIHWWTEGNRLCTHVYLAPEEHPYNYYNVTHRGLTTCIWDMVIHNYERNTWVERMVLPEVPDIEGYLYSYPAQLSHSLCSFRE